MSQTAERSARHHRGGSAGLSFPIVLYNGAEPWTAKTDLKDLIAPNLPPQLRHWQPQMRYLLRILPGFGVFRNSSRRLRCSVTD